MKVKTPKEIKHDNFFYLPDKDEKKDEKAKEAEGKEDGESGDVKYPYPKSVFFIISTELCERFSFYGMKSKCYPSKEVFFGTFVF